MIRSKLITERIEKTKSIQILKTRLNKQLYKSFKEQRDIENKITDYENDLKRIEIFENILLKYGGEKK